MNIRDPFKVIDGIELWMKKIEDAPTPVFRNFVRRVFTEILYHTPQWSGKAVANWNVAVGSPDYSWDDNVGDRIDWSRANVAMNPRHVGVESPWIDYALVRNEPIIAGIKRRDKVYITNAVRGDDDNGKAGSDMYLEALQDPAYWTQKLRAVNQPYEIAAETLIRVVRDFENGIGLTVTRAGGDNLERL